MENEEECGGRGGGQEFIGCLRTSTQTHIKCVLKLCGEVERQS